MKSLRFAFALALFTASSALSQQPPPRDEWFAGLDLEDAAGKAELVLVARIEDVGEIKVVHGGKGESVTYQVHFKPLRVMKGVFARNELVLGSSELGAYRFGGEMGNLKAGQSRLLFLGRNDVGYSSVNTEERSLDHALPPVAGENDPLLQSVAALLAVRAEPDRLRRVGLLADSLVKIPGPAAVPLLAAVSRRALPAAQRAGIAPVLTRHLSDASPAVRTSAASALQAVLAADYLERADLRAAASAALMAAISGGGQSLVGRATLFEAVGELGTIRDPALVAMLDFEKPTRSLAARNAQIVAVGQLRLAAYKDALLGALRNLPLDAPFQTETETAAARVDAAAGVAAIAARAEEKIAAGLRCDPELQAAETLPDPDAVELLLRLAALPLGAQERRLFAGACVGVCERKPDERLVAPLVKLLDPPESESRGYVVEALLRIGSQAAAQALQPRIAQEQNLHTKLRIAELLGKHGMRDGYAFAIEHVSEPYLTAQAVAALVAMRDPRTVEEATKILDTSNDTTWNRAAIRLLGALGRSEIAPRLMNFVADWKNPLAPAALTALADLGDARVLPKIKEALAARSDSIVIAGAAAARRILSRPGIDAGDIRDQLAALLADSSASEQTRRAALDALAALNDPRLDRVLATVEGDANLERTDLLARIERLLRERKVSLPAAP
jgi:HEAT repeat protein